MMKIVLLLLAWIIAVFASDEIVIMKKIEGIAPLVLDERYDVKMIETCEKQALQDAINLAIDEHYKCDGHNDYGLLDVRIKKVYERVLESDKCRVNVDVSINKSPILEQHPSLEASICNGIDPSLLIDDKPWRRLYASVFYGQTGKVDEIALIDGSRKIIYTYKNVPIYNAAIDYRLKLFNQYYGSIGALVGMTKETYEDQEYSYDISVRNDGDPQIFRAGVEVGGGYRIGLRTDLHAKLVYYQDKIYRTYSDSTFTGSHNSIAFVCGGGIYLSPEHILSLSITSDGSGRVALSWEL